MKVEIKIESKYSEISREDHLVAKIYIDDKWAKEIVAPDTDIIELLKVLVENEDLVEMLTAKL